VKGKVPNIIWILVDSVRIYHTDADERGRLDAMDEFAKDAIDFRTAITSAPSTIMSVSAMLTGIPATYQSRDYESFKYEYENMKSLPSILRKNGYKTYGLLFWPDGRNFLGNLFGDTCSDLWKDKYDENEYWSNDIQLEIFDRFLESDKTKDNFFVWLHLNCRFDKDISDKVELLINKLKKLKLYDESIIILNSDHGYPDPKRGISFYDKSKYGHDLILSDDNILAPQLIKFPEIESKRIEQPISTLDLVPTIINYLGFDKDYDNTEYPTHGRNLIESIKGKKEWTSKIVRVDNRFIFQSNIVTALRDDRYKYIMYEEENREEFFDIKKDPLENINLISKDTYKNILQKFRDEYQKQKNDILKYHTDLLDKNFSILFKSTDDFLFIGNFNDNFIKIFTKILERRIKSLNEYNLQGKKINNLIKLYITKPDSSKLNIVVFPVSKLPKLNSQMVKIGESLKNNNTKLHFFNYNFVKISPPQHWFLYSVKKSKKKFQAFFYNPKSVLFSFYTQIKRIVFNEDI